MIEIPLSNLFHRKARSLISILAVALGIALLLILVGLTHGSIREVAERIQSVGADLLVQPAGASTFLGLKSGVLPSRYGEEIANVDGVKEVAPVLTWTTTFRNNFYVVYGIEAESLRNVGGSLEFLEGREPSHPQEIMIDRRLAHTTGLKVGDTVELLDMPFRVSGVYRAGVGARICMPMETLADALHLEDRVSLFFVRCEEGADVGTVAEETEARYPALKTRLMEGLSRRMEEGMFGLRQFITAITATTLIVSLLVILLAMYTTVLERTREVGTLRSLGASKSRIAGLVVAESVILTVAGVLLGFLLAHAGKAWMSVRYPLLTVTITPARMALASLIGLTGGVIGALYPAFRAARMDPVKALMYE